MIFVFAALYCEAEPLIRRYGLKPDGRNPFGGFVSEDNSMKVILTGIGKTNAAAAVSYVCAADGVTSGDLLVNVGTCAGGKGRDGAYLVNAVRDCDTGRMYYPDMLFNTGLPESAVTTVSTVATGETTSSDDSMLWEMEASGFCDAARLFMPPHRVALIKAVSDRGNDDAAAITDEILKGTIERNIEVIAHAIDVLSGVPSEDTEEITAEDKAELFKCSETMRQDLIKLLTYARNSGIDACRILDDMRSEGLIPAADRRRGKEALNEFCRRLPE